VWYDGMMLKVDTVASTFSKEMYKPIILWKNVEFLLVTKSFKTKGQLRDNKKKKGFFCTIILPECMNHENIFGCEGTIKFMVKTTIRSAIILKDWNIP